mmetsp:Transcript_13998/g.59919  ORF Transcript_13998/g.59919 Transcript_13998/m.59919 type:complete len:331 (-) Transcript_13998:643-1635(-)
MRAQSVFLRARAQPVKAAHGRVRKRRRGFRGRAHQRSAECNRRGRRQRTAKRASREQRRTRYRESRDRAARTFAKRRGRPFAVKDDGFERRPRERREPLGERSSRRGFEQRLVSGTRLSGPLGPPARVVGGRVARVAGSGLRERVRRGSRLSVFERARSDAHLFRGRVVRAPQRLERLHRYRPRVQLGERQLGVGVGVGERARRQLGRRDVRLAIRPSFAEFVVRDARQQPNARPATQGPSPVRVRGGHTDGTRPSRRVGRVGVRKRHLSRKRGRRSGGCGGGASGGRRRSVEWVARGERVRPRVRSRASLASFLRRALIVRAPQRRSRL